ncbi:DUF3558 domain-containing protein [Hoyosella subflava]|uniref:DUF3558 domain-containing protein n=1 Tax=Hoyosella subflava (strain DSM 45089 / JCM 17490 / NBRC 109087 / DQS3-9A1) TaxID=443218 RepID=F6EHV5_HOYSD|nr:DUF3558 domain-containing protein [Hoyosella subflava]AEF38903.1 hypothetical protein AS9A_0446 [Hoyosella subflava DQS3-9A1]
MPNRCGFKWRRALACGAAAALLGAGLVGCTREIEGTARADGSVGQVDSQEFLNLLDECEFLPAEDIAEVFDADGVSNTFFGAICRYDVYGPLGTVGVTLAWFEDGSLWRERRATEQLGYEVNNVSVAGQGGFEVRIPDDPMACGVATRSGDGGSLTWWVHPQGSRAGVNSCDAALELAEMSVRMNF